MSASQLMETALVINILFSRRREFFFKKKSLLIFYSIASILWFGYFGLEACGVLAPLPGIKPIPPALKGEVLTTGLPGKSPGSSF